MSNSNRIKIARSLSRENLPSVLEYGEPAYVKNAQFVIGNGDGSEFIINDWSNLLNKPSSFPAIAAEDIPAFRFVAQDSSGELILANRTSLAEATVVGISTEEILTDETGTVLRSGSITNPAWSLTPGLQYYLDTDGTIRSTVPDLSTDAVAAIGTAQTSTTLFVSLNAPRLHDLGDAVNPGVNFANGHFEASTAGWVRYDDGAVATPVDGTGGTPSYLTFARTTSSPLVGTGSGLMTKSAASALGEGVSYDFTIDRGLLHEVAKVEFQYEASANYADGYVGVFLYDKTNASLIPISVQDIPASYGKPGTFLATFIPSTSTEYRLIFHVTTDTTTEWTMMIDNVVIGNKDIAVGAAISEWQTYPISIDGVVVGTGGSYNGKWRRVGSNMEYQGHFVFGTSGFVMPGPPMVLNLPLGLTADASKVSRETGWSRLNGNAQSYDSSAALGYLAIPVLKPDGKISFITHGSGAVGLSNPFAWAANDEFYFNISVPISQWTSNVNLASDFTEYAYNYSTTTTSDSTSFAYGSEGAAFQAFAPTGITAVTKLVKFQRPIQPTDIITLEALIGGKWSSFYNNAPFIGNFATNDAGTTYYGASLNPVTGDPSTIAVYFYSGPFVGASWSSLASAGYRWRVRKVSNGNMAEVPPLVRAEYRLATQSFTYSGGNTQTINFNIKNEDTHNAVTTGSDWKFTAPISGVYDITVGLIGPSLAWPLGCHLEFEVRINGASVRFIARQEGPAYTGFMPISGSASFRLNAGDYLSVNLYVQTSITTVSDARYNYITITRIGS